MTTKFIIPLACLLIGGFLGYNLSPNSPPSVTETRNPSNQYHLINPLLECNAAFNDTNLNSLKQTISTAVDNSITAGNITFASVYYRNLNNGPWFGINEKEKFSPASMIKVPLMISLLKTAQNNPDYLDTSITNNRPTIPASDQLYPPKVTLAPDQKYSISSLIENMIIYSDNIAYDLLVLNTDNQNFKKTFTELGILLPSPQEVNLKDFITVKDYSSFFRVLYNASYLSAENSQKALDLLTKTTFNDGLTALLPADVAVAHKFGERFSPEKNEVQLHDCGIVYYPQNPYLLCLMTRGQNPKKMATFIGQTSKQIYDYLQSHQ